MGLPQDWRGSRVMNGQPEPGFIWCSGWFQAELSIFGSSVTGRSHGERRTPGDPIRTGVDAAVANARREALLADASLLPD